MSSVLMKMKQLDEDKSKGVLHGLAQKKLEDLRDVAKKLRSK